MIDPIDQIELPAPELAEPEAALPTDALAGVPAALDAALRRRGFTSLTSVQRSVLDAESDGRDLRISSQTGSGKTVAIGLALAPRLIAAGARSAGQRRGPSVLVLVPTRELAMQVRDELHWLFADVPDVDLEVVMGGTSTGLERRALSRGPRIVVATPGRALDHLRNRALVGDGVAHVVLDESDRMLDMGFREDLEAILECMPKERRTHLVSATFPASVRKLADRFQRHALHVEGTKLGAANCDIEHVGHVVDRHGAHAAIVNLLLLNEGQRCLIFVERRIEATALAEKLSADGFPVQSFSGDLPQAQRTRTINAFRDGTMKTLVSTDVAARGIDVPNIELVIHATPPDNADTYVHRSGRTGRAGSTGRSVLLVAPKSRRRVTGLLSQARIQLEWQPVPSVTKVERQLRKRFRQHLHERLADEAQPSQQQADYAKKLLDGRDPAVVVATLLEMAQPKPARPPMEIAEPAAHDPRSEKPSRSDFVGFTINWGSKDGAAANRLLSHVCRRGQIRGNMVGSIKIGPAVSRFEVAASAAGRFEALVRKPDPREPKLRIQRERGAPPQAGRKASSERPAKQAWKKRAKRK